MPQTQGCSIKVGPWVEAEEGRGREGCWVGLGEMNAGGPRGLFSGRPHLSLDPWAEENWSLLCPGKVAAYEKGVTQALLISSREPRAR